MFNWKVKEIKATNAIFLGDKTEGEGRPFKARFLQAGLVKYDFGVCLLKKETIDRFINTFIDCPVIINHKDDIKKEDKQGTIKSIWFAPEDGWFWCSGVLDEEAAEKVEKGFNVSCQYRITEYSNNTENKLHNGNPYDKEILNGVFEHLAIVKTPRYEDAYIAVNAIMATNEDQWITIGADEEAGRKGKHILVKEGQTKEEAIKEKFQEWASKDKKQGKLFDTDKYYDKDYYNKQKEKEEEFSKKIKEAQEKEKTDKENKKQEEIKALKDDAKKMDYDNFYEKYKDKFEKLGYNKFFGGLEIWKEAHPDLDYFDIAAETYKDKKQEKGDKKEERIEARRKHQEVVKKHNQAYKDFEDGKITMEELEKADRELEKSNKEFYGKQSDKPGTKEKKENYFKPAKGITQSLKDDYKAGKITAKEVARELSKANLTPYMLNDDEALKKIGIEKKEKTKEEGGKDKIKDFYEKEYQEALKEIAEGKDYAQINFNTDISSMKMALAHLKRFDTDWDAYDVDENIKEYADLSDDWNKEQIGRIAREKAAQETLKKWIEEGKDRKNEYYKIYEPEKAKNSFLDSFKDFVYNKLTEELNDRLGELIALNEERWITIHPHGDVEDENGKKDYRRLKIEDGETPKEAIDRVYKKDDKKPKVYTEKNYDEFHKLYYKDNADKWTVKKGKGNYYTIDRTKNGIGIITHKKFEELDKYLQDNTFNLDIPKSKVRGKDELQENKDALKTFTDKGFKVIAQYDDGYHIKYILENTNKKTEDKQNNDTNIKAKELIKKKRETVNEHNKKYNYYKRNYEKFNSSEEKKLRNELMTLKNQYYAIEEEEKEYIKDHSKAYSLNADIVGVKKEKPMDFEKADNKNVNPNYARDNYEYSHNCQSSVVAYEARRRGYNVEVVARSEDDKTQQLAEHSSWAYIDKSTNKLCEAKAIYSTNSINLYNKLEDQIKPNERYQFAYNWFRGKSQHGHVITIERNEKGEIRLYDPQTDEKYIGKENITRYLKEQVSYKKPTRLLRVDDKDFNEYFINDVVKKK